jgi:hypothetical protein
MRILLLATVPAFIAACATIADDATFAERVAAYTKTACGFVPAAHVVAILADDPRFTTAAEVAAAVCHAVQAGAPPAGVAIK